MTHFPVLLLKTLCRFCTKDRGSGPRWDPELIRCIWDFNTDWIKSVISNLLIDMQVICPSRPAGLGQDFTQKPDLMWRQSAETREVKVDVIIKTQTVGIPPHSSNFCSPRVGISIAKSRSVRT